MKNMQMGAVITLAMVLAGCGGDDDPITPAADAGGGGTDAHTDDASVPPGDAGSDAGPEWVECDLRDEPPCSGDAQCVGYTGTPAEWWLHLEELVQTRVCRDGLRVAEGLPCTWQSLGDREGLTYEIDNCEEGTLCTDFAVKERTCRRICGPDLATCDPGTRCLHTQGLYETERLGLCIPDSVAVGCDAVLQTGCATGEVCFLYRDPFEPASGSGRCYPRADIPPGAYEYSVRLGSRCEIGDCAYGQACVDEGDEMHCRKLCDTSGTGTPGALPPEDGVPWGTCPPSAPTCMPLLADYVTPAGACR